MVVKFIFSEGSIIWKDAHGFFGQNGLIQITKNVTHEKAPQFIAEFLELLRFPCLLRVDAHGFISDDSRELIGFQFASRNTSITLMNDKSYFHISSTEANKEAYDYFNQMSGETFLSKWFDAHDQVSELTGSGFGAKRTTTLVLYLEPENMTAEEIFAT